MKKKTHRRQGFVIWDPKRTRLEGEEEENLCAEPSLEHVFFFFSLDGLVTLWLSRARVCLEAVTKPRDRDEISFVESRPETVSLDGQRIDKDYEIRFAVRNLVSGSFSSFGQGSPTGELTLKPLGPASGRRKRKTPGRALGRVKLRIMNRPKAGPDVF